MKGGASCIVYDGTKEDPEDKKFRVRELPADYTWFKNNGMFRIAIYSSKKSKG